MSIKRIIGIDFGTSTSVIRVKRYEDGTPVGDRLYVKEVKFGNNGLVPTLIQHIRDGEPYYGYEAQKKHKNSVLFENFKVDLESMDAEKKSRAKALTEEFFTYLAGQYKDQSAGGFFGEAGDIEKTLVSYPVKWSDETRSFMLETARKAGFPNVEGMDEAQAAIGAVMVQSSDYLEEKGYLHDGRPVNILMADMGAGTTDLVLCRYTPGTNPKYEVLSTWPKEGSTLFGGREMEELLREYLKEKLPAEDAEAVMKRCGTEKFKSWKEEYVSPALKRGEAVTEFSDLDTITELLEIEMEGYALDRAELEKLAVNYLRGFPRLVNGCLKDAEIHGSEVDLVLLTGGHSQWYFVAELLSGRISQCGEIELDKIRKDPGRIIPVPLPQETVALGLVYSPMVEQIRFAAAKEPFTTKESVSKSVETPKAVSINSETTLEQLQSDMEEAMKLRVWRELPATPEEEFEFREVEGGYEVASYLGHRVVVSIPSRYKGKPVLAVGEEAFSKTIGRALELRVVEIPSSCYWIKEKAFNNSAFSRGSLEKVILHCGLINIGKSAFAYNSTLSSVTLPEGLVGIEKWAFFCCDLRNVFVPASCRIIEDAVFCGNRNLKKVFFPLKAQIEYLNDRTFADTNVHRIKIPGSCSHGSLIYESGGLLKKAKFITVEHY